MERINPRDVYGETLVKLGEQNPNIVVLDADLSKSTKTYKFGERFPDRFFNGNSGSKYGIGSCRFSVMR